MNCSIDLGTAAEFAQTASDMPNFTNYGQSEPLSSAAIKGVPILSKLNLVRFSLKDNFYHIGFSS